MPDKSFQIKSWLRYWLDSVDHHSLHSPFFFDFYTTLLNGKSEANPDIENLRTKLAADTRSIVVNDLGTGSRINSIRTISSIATKSLSTQKFSELFVRIINRYGHKTVIELGTSLGVNALYLATKKDAKVHTFEGAQEVASLASLTFEFGKAKNINLITGNIDTTLSDFLSGVRKIDFALIDANHTYEATTRYLNQLLPRTHERTVIVIDDIHASAGMERAWNQAITSELVYSSADLYRCGLLFFDPSLNKQHVILQF